MCFDPPVSPPIHRFGNREAVKNFELPPAPGDQAGAVKAWAQPVTLPTYAPQPPDRNPMFLESRVYQGSSGRVYPLPFTDRIATEPCEHSWNALHIENEFLRLMILPEIGGRIHVGFDKTNEYDFFYRQNVIKPALVGLGGPWISGGVEFNWPQHHRPATFMPVQYKIERHADGSITIWCGDHDPMNRLRGEHGICLHPGNAVVELKVRLYNRTLLTQTFLWWANVAARVHELYQSFFPADVHFVADHARRAMSTFPLCTGRYYGVDYQDRALHGIPSEETPRCFVPPGSYPVNDLSWYANIPVPTSYMAIGSTEDFFGGYDHARAAGLVHVANHHIAPGKKQWTWGNHEFGYAWDRNLTNHDGPYIELMAGVYTDNQPDFSFLAPGETRTFSQYWYPIQQIGPPQKANVEAAVSLTLLDNAIRLGVYLTRQLPQATVRLERNGEALAEFHRDIGPGSALIETIALSEGIQETALKLSVKSSDGRVLISYQPQSSSKREVPSSAVEPLLPEKIRTTEELYLIGLHLAQYRHATRHADAYWREALHRDPADARCNNALGFWYLQRGEFLAAETHLRKAIAALTRFNANPYDGEPYYNLGLTLRFSGNFDDAYDSFYKATWNYAWRAASFYAIAEIDCRRGEWRGALGHALLALRTNADHLNARNLLVLILRELGRPEEADQMLRETRALDPLDFWSLQLATGAVAAGNQVRLDIAFDYLRAGFFHSAVKVLEAGDYSAKDGSVPMLLYSRAHSHSQLGDRAAARDCYLLAAQAEPEYCFPSRLEEMLVLDSAMNFDPLDARAHYYLGNLLYDRRRHHEAILRWERAAELDRTFPTVWRNLGIGSFNVLRDAEKALSAFEQAFKAGPSDARVLYERDQLWKRTGAAPDVRLRELESHFDLVASRDDLSVELASLYNQTHQPDRALAMLQSRKFQPWEGGEGLALGQHVRTHLALGRRALLEGQSHEALRLFEAALKSPANLGEAKHLLASQNNIYYWLGSALQAAGDEKNARTWWRKAAQTAGDFQEMSVKTFSEMTYYRAMALKRLGEDAGAKGLLEELLSDSKKLARQKAGIDYFATSLPAMLLFDDDLDERKNTTASFRRAQALLGLGKSKQAGHLLRRILQRDPNHALAIDLIAEIHCETRLRKLAAVEI
jgi:tetratricopeptide (TPR) repeat protein